jgi:hypothetical protein
MQGYFKEVNKIRNSGYWIDLNEKKFSWEPKQKQLKWKRDEGYILANPMQNSKI